MSSLVQQEIARVQSAAVKALNLSDSVVSTELNTSTYRGWVHYKVYAARERHTDYIFVEQQEDESTKAFIKRFTREIKEHFKV